jgi:thiosulfate/3-mercaptopyruvate sulfurtransferase
LFREARLYIVRESEATGGGTPADAVVQQPAARRISMNRFGHALVVFATVLWTGGAIAQQAPAPSADEVRSDLLVSAAWLAESLDDPGIAIVHVGTDRNLYDAGHIPGARFLSLREIVVEEDGNLNQLPDLATLVRVFAELGVGDDARIVVYGEPLHAARTFFTLDYLGHGDRTALLNGGLPAWKAAGRALSDAPPTVAPAGFTPRVQADRVVDADWVARHLDDPRVALIDARPSAQFAGEEAGGVERPGHIPGASNVFWQEMLQSAEQPLLKDPEALRQRFAGAGATADGTVVAYCRTGVQASMTYFVARFLGYDVKMYDGSFQDWSRRAELPVAR